MRLLLVVSSPAVGGGEQYLLSLTRGLTTRGHRVVAACSENLAPLFQDHGAVVYRIRIGRKLGKRNYWQLILAPLTFFVLLGSLRRIQREQAIELVHVQYKKEQILVSLAARCLGIQVVWTEHGPMHRFIAANPLLRYAYGRAALLASRIICVSDATVASLRSLGLPGARLVRIHNGIECHPLEEFREPQDGEKRLILVGRLIPGKGHLDLLNAMQLLRRDGLNPRLLIVGEGPLRNELEEYIDKSELANIEFTGQVAHSEVEKLIQSADIFVMPSTGEGEGLPYVVLEAMERAKPVIASRVGGIVEQVVDGSTGVLVPPGDPHALAGAISSLLGNPPLAEAMGQKGRARVEAEFSMDSMLKCTESVFLESARWAHREIASVT